jgi:phage host-nuclease inhibitor protein Gam
MDAFITALITALITSLGSGGLLTWYFKKRIEHRYELKLNEHEANLKRDYDIQIANLNAQLQIAHVRFSQIFSKQADTIAQIYQNLLPLLDATEDYTALIQSSETKEINAKLATLNQASNTFFLFYRPNKIYLPRSTAQKLTAFLDTIVSIIRKHTMLESMTSLHSQFTGKNTERYGREIDELKASVTPLLLDLESDFQTVLGVYKEE